MNKKTKNLPVKSKKENFDLVNMEDDFFRNPFEGFFKPLQLPNTDIENKGKELEVTVDLPVIDKKDIKINVQKNFLEINAEKKNERTHEKQNFFAQERSFSGFYRRYVLPSSVDVNKTNCDFKNGVLKITLPKLKQEKEKPKLITLK